MDASTAVVWVCVGIFAATAIVYFLYLSMTVKMSDKQSAARSYAVSASDFGNPARQLMTAHAQEHDFVLLSIDRAAK